MTCFYWGEAQVQQLHKDWDSLLSKALLYVPSVLHIVYTNMLATVYKTVAQSLTEYGERGRGDPCWFRNSPKGEICLNTESAFPFSFLCRIFFFVVVN